MPEYASLPQENRVSREEIPISVVVPVYNEVHTIGLILDRILRCGFDTEIIAVDDGSTDGSREFLARYEHPRVKCFFQDRNRGKGAASTDRGFSEDRIGCCFSGTTWAIGS
jgi:cellulose synthase/poly-beta-1,6-N-acetylglucosamine synthase-like glycosyltransferase